MHGCFSPGWFPPGCSEARGGSRPVTPRVPPRARARLSHALPAVGGLSLALPAPLQAELSQMKARRCWPCCSGPGLLHSRSGAPPPVAGHPQLARELLSRARQVTARDLRLIIGCSPVKTTQAFTSAFPRRYRTRSSVPGCRAPHCLGTCESAWGAVSFLDRCVCGQAVPSPRKMSSSYR